MPFFLVMQTLLVEADNEQDAAERAAKRIRSGEKLTVSVKADETTITHINVAAAVESERTVSSPTAEIGIQSPMAESQAVVAMPTGRKLIFRRIVADVLSLVRPRT